MKRSSQDKIHGNLVAPLGAVRGTQFENHCSTLMASEVTLPIFVYNFLQDRTFSVKLPGNVISEVFVQENGVSQSSVLSPILFYIMINDILSTTPVPRNLK